MQNCLHSEVVHVMSSWTASLFEKTLENEEINLRVVLIDDEPLILAHFEKLLSKIGDINIVGTFINPYEGLENIEQNQPDIVFLDIEMPEINGVELAEIIQSRWPFVKIVFVTAHSGYAVKAFDLNAVDYLLKPVQIDRLRKTIERLREQLKNTTIYVNNEEMVCCFHSLQFKTFEVLDVRWRTSKAKELFSFLLQHRGKPVSKSVLLDLFWPESDWNKGFAHLYTTIYQIRQLLSSINFNIKIKSLDNNYILELNGVKVDVQDWEQEIEFLPPIREQTLSQYLKVIDAYRGNYLEEEGYLWAESERERLRALWLSHATKVAEYLVSNGQYIEAISIHHRIQDLFPYVEDNYFTLMRLYDKLGDRASVKFQYRNLEKVSTEYGIDPNPCIQKWYQERMNIQPE